MLPIKIEHLTKYYKDHLVIDNLSIDIAQGQVVVFQGPSGIGKSTFLRCLTYLEPFQEGSVWVDDLKFSANMDIHKYKRTIKLVRMRLGFVFQFFNLFPHLTVLENLIIAPMKVLHISREKAHDQARALLRRVGLQEKANSYPSSLSGGQGQRVAIARALAMQPKALLLDEPTSSLDPLMKHEITEVIEDFAKDGLTMLIVTHEPAFVEKIANSIVKFGPRCIVQYDTANQ